MTSPTKLKWTFRARFRRHAFGWRSQPAIKRIKETVPEIKKAARRDSVLGAEGAVLFLEKLSPAIQNADGSSGAIGRAVNHSIDTLVPIITKAPAEGFGYEITGAEVMDAYQYTIKAAEKAGCKLETFKRNRDIVSREKGGDRFVTRVLGHKLGLG